MGFFSWITSDTQESISNVYSDKGALPVYVIWPDNSFQYEEKYEGYGVFNGVDVYERIAEINGLGKDRQKGINLVFDNNDSGDFSDCTNVLVPKFARKFTSYDMLPHSVSCPRQGYFYEDAHAEDYNEEDEDA
jgi:hypothetical protein